jgi:hypothetical protein
MKKLLLMLMMLAFVLPAAMAGEKTIVINRNEGIYEDGTGVYYCSKGGITMTFSSGLNNVNYLVEHQQVVFDIFSTNYVIKKIKFNCLDNTTDDNLDCFYWGPSTISELGAMATYVPTGTYTWSGYIGTWVGGSTPSKYIKFVTEAKPVRFGSVEITIDKEFGDIYDLVTQSSEIAAGQTYALVSKYDSRALGKEEYHGSDSYTTFSSTPVTLLNFDETLNNYMKVKVTDEVALMKLQSSGNSSRPWYIKIGDNYMRRRTGTLSGSGGPANGQGYNLYTESSVPSDRAQYFRTNISLGNNYNALIRFEMFSSETPLGTETFAIRHYNGGDLFRVIDYNTSNNQYANNQRVYLYKPAQTYYVTTNCLPDDNSGYITLGDGVLSDGNGNYTSQQYDNVSFFVGPTEGWGIGAVTVTYLSTNEVTTLTPTNTSDFGNDYQFPMPGANVNVTANFLQPFNIDTICNPVGGGVFNFISGSTDFNGQHKSNEGKTVTFKPEAADGYIFNSVTYTDNVTGETTTLTPDADGVYSFVMPGNDVTLTANFEAAHDLYLLGTANGRTSWIPSGPKFTFDGTNQEYYIDVYFKGGNDDPNTDPAYGYFSLTKKIDEGGNWNNIQGYRLAAENNNTWVEDGYTGVRLYDDRPNNAFKIQPGVYRIKVNQDMTEMSIIEYPLTVTFNPASGTVVDAGDVVNFTSNLNDLVHAINSQEVQATYNSYDNWGVTTSDNTHTITHEGTTTVTGQSHIGYITATGTADYEIVGDLYLLGTANGMNSWQPYGPKFTYDATTETYSLDVYFTGLNVTAADEGYGYFSLSSVISDPNNPNWNDIPNSARYNAEYNDEPITGLNYNESVTEELYQTDPNWCFKIDPGVYTITVNKGKTEMTVTKHELTLTFDPVSGTTVAAGDPVNIYSNLEQIVHAINPDELLHATIEYATSTDGSLPTPYEEGSTVTITAVGATTTVNAVAELGYINVSGNADYIVPAPAVYGITTIVNPEGAGDITAPADAAVGTTVTFTVDTNEGYRLDQVQVTYGSNLAILDYTYNPETGEYSFVMPNDEVRIYADYTHSHAITTVVNPELAGTINVAADAFAGDAVSFTVTRNTGFAITSVTVTYGDGNTQTVAVTDNGDGTYSFVMPAADVTVTANFDMKGEIFKLVTATEEIVEGKTYTFVTQDNDQVLNYISPDAVPNHYSSTDIVEWMVPDKSAVKLDGNACFFTPEDVTEFTSSVNMLHRSAYLKTAGGYIGFDLENASHDKEPLALYSSRDDVRKFATAVYTNNTSNSKAFSMYDYYGVEAWSFYWVVLYDDSEGFLMGRPGLVPNVWLYKLAEPYNITTAVLPDASVGSLAIEQTDGITGTTACEGVPVTVTPTAEAGYAVSSLVVTVDGTSETVPVTRNVDGSYSFVMPSADVTVTATFDTGYNIYTECHPIGGGEITVVPLACAGQIITFDVSANAGYALNRISIYNDQSTDAMPFNYNNDGTCNFTMPAANVYIDAYFEPGYTLEFVFDPEGGGSITKLDPVMEYYPEDEEIWATVVPNTGYEIQSVTMTNKDTGDESELQLTGNGINFDMPPYDVIITVHLALNSPLSYIERPGTYEDGDEVEVTDELIGTWAAQKYLWAKDQAPYVSNFYSEMNPESEYIIHDYHRQYFKLQHRDWDQSNWVMLDFSTIPELAGYSQQQLMAVMNNYVDNKIVAGSIKGTYRCVTSNSDPFGVYQDQSIKIQHVIELSELPQYVKDPATIGPNNTLGYPGFQNDPLETAGKYYANPVANYAYNHYSPANFMIGNLGPDGVEGFDTSGEFSHEGENGYLVSDHWFFMRPKDQEVVQVWAVWLGEKDYYDSFSDEERTDSVFVVYEWNPDDGYNSLGIDGAFRVESWDYNINQTDDSGKPTSYGPPTGELRKDLDYTFHAAIQYTPYNIEIDPVKKVPSKAPMAADDNPEFFNVYPLDMKSPDDTVTGVKEVQSRDAVSIVDIRYYNIMGQESTTPFDGINIMVVRYKDGSMISKKILK